MHELFRLLGQQMGMERIRVILPASIDGYLNDAIIEITNNIIKSNVQGQYREKYIISDNFVSPVNGISTLYGEINKDDDFTNLDGKTEITVSIQNCLYLYSFAIKYEDNRYRNCRIIEPDKLEQSLDDYLNRPTARYPIVHIASFTGEQTCEVEVYSGNKDIKGIKVKYIKKPAVVSFNEQNQNGTDCDLPIHLHKDVVELAVQKFFNSVGSTTHNVRQ